MARPLGRTARAGAAHHPSAPAVCGCTRPRLRADREALSYPPQGYPPPGTVWNGWWWNGWQWLPLPAYQPRRPPLAAEIGERIGARVVDGILGFAVVYLLAPAVGPTDRPVLSWLIGLAVVAAAETVTTALWGGSVGKLVVGLRVRELDHGSTVRWSTSAKRAIMNTFIGASYVLNLLQLGSVLAGANRRGFHDRRWDTIVVPKQVTSVARSDLASFDAEDRPAPVTPWGPTAPIDRRLRARTLRLEHAPFLVLAMVVTLWALEHAGSVGWVILASLGFLLVFIVDETVRIHRTGGNAGHHAAGLTVVDVRTGRPPSLWRSFWRAFVLSWFLYVPPLQLIIAINVFASSQWRGIHDYAGRTAVIRRPEG